MAVFSFELCISMLEYRPIWNDYDDSYCYYSSMVYRYAEDWVLAPDHASRPRRHGRQLRPSLVKVSWSANSA